MILKELLDFVEKLYSASLHFNLSAPTSRAIMITVVVPGERWEIEFHEDGEVGVEVFRSSGEIADAKKLEDLFQLHGD